MRARKRDERRARLEALDRRLRGMSTLQLSLLAALLGLAAGGILLLVLKLLDWAAPWG